MHIKVDFSSSSSFVDKVGVELRITLQLTDRILFKLDSNSRLLLEYSRKSFFESEKALPFISTFLKLRCLEHQNFPIFVQ